MLRLSHAPIHLSEAHRQELMAVVRTGTSSRRLVSRARIILLAGDGKGVRETARLLGTSCATVQRWRQRWLAAAYDSSATTRLTDTPRSGAPTPYPPESPGAMIARADRAKNRGRSSVYWTRQDTANGAIQRGIVDQISPPSIGYSLKRGFSAAAPRPGVADTEGCLQVHTICRLLALALCLCGAFFLTLNLPSAEHTPSTPTPAPAPAPDSAPTPTPPFTPATQEPTPPPSTAAVTLEAYTRRVARTFGVDEALALAVLVQESDPVDPLKAGKGDSRGPLQIKPIALEDVGLSPDEHSLPLLVRGGILYLREMLIRFRSLPIALAAYNMGPECLRQRDYRPYTSTQDYISQVLVRAEAIRAGTFPSPPILRYRTHSERAKG